MSATSQARVIKMDDFLDLSKVKLYDGSPVLQIQPPPDGIPN